MKQGAGETTFSMAHAPERVDRYLQAMDKSDAASGVGGVAGNEADGFARSRRRACDFPVKE